MRSAEERIRSLHKRADYLTLERDRRRLVVSAIAAALLLTVLSAVLTPLLIRSGPSVWDASEASYAGSSLLADNAGGYVLAAVVAFILGVAVTAGIKLYRDKSEQNRTGAGDGNTGQENPETTENVNKCNH